MAGSGEGPASSPRWVRWAVFGTGAVAFVLGVIGWSRTGLDIWDSLYGSAALFVLSFDRPEGAIPVLLQVGRFLALAAFTGAVVLVALAAFGRRLPAWRARTKDRTTLLLGAGCELVPLATALRAERPERWIIVVADVGAQLASQLREVSRVIVLHPDEAAESRAVLVRKARERFVLGATDRESLALARGIAKDSPARPFPERVLFDNPDVTAMWNAGEEDRRGGVSRNSLIAAHVLRVAPPRPEGAISPPPMIIGDGPLATEVLRSIVRGWQQPGERVLVHCLGSNDSWVDAGLDELKTRAERSWTPVGVHAGSVVERVGELIGEWVQPTRVSRVEVVGPLIVVAFPDDALTATVAEKLAHCFPEARITAVLGRCGDWEHATRGHPELHLVGINDVLGDLPVLRQNRIDLLSEEIVAELGRWPHEITGLLDVSLAPGTVARLDDQPGATRAAVRAIAEQIQPILAAGRLEVSRSRRVESPPILCSPDDLAAMAARLADVLAAHPEARPSIEPAEPAAIEPAGHAEPTEGADTEHDNPERTVRMEDPDLELRLRRLEFVARLPTLAARAGFSPHRADGVEDDLGVEQIRELAMGAHETYLQTASATQNATGSWNADKVWNELDLLDRESNLAQAYDSPVKLAMVGRTWRASPEPAINEFSEAEVELLGEMEHRRWHHFQLRTGRPGHDWAQEWRWLKDAIKEYDYDFIRSLPERLAQAGLEIVPAGDPGEPTGPTPAQ